MKSRDFITFQDDTPAKSLFKCLVIFQICNEQGLDEPKFIRRIQRPAQKLLSKLRYHLRPARLENETGHVKLTHLRKISLYLQLYVGAWRCDNFGGNFFLSVEITKVAWSFQKLIF